MPMYTYAFLNTPTSAIELPSGIVSALELVTCDRLSALVEPELSFETLQDHDAQLVQAVLTHDRVIRELFEQTALLPLRFGTRFLSTEGLLAHLQTHSQEYLEKLARVTGKAEYTLKLTPLVLEIEATLPTEAQGREYFLAKKRRFQSQYEQQQQQTAEWQTLVQAIAQIYPEPVLGEAQDGSQRVYLLVSSQESSQLYKHLQAWQIHCPHWELTLSEALPPYHFV
ncbi:MAG TPA: GvpL/GvpF family gas vesicle protein [Candidatus Obscuribacterales bacterium]